MKVSELARELRVAVGEVQRAARSLQITAKDPTFELKAIDVRTIREHFASRAANGDSGTPPAGGAAALPPVAPPVDPLAALRGLMRPIVRPTLAPARGEGAVELLCHAEFLDWMEAPDTPGRLKQRANLVLRQFLGQGRPSLVKSVAGAGRGWRRTPLGGNGGMQFYLWWAPAGAIPVENTPLSGRQVLVRAVRHHDETDTGLPAGAPVEWLPLSPAELDTHFETFGFAFSEEQRRIAADGAPIRLIKGHPGTGKTTTLWLAVGYAEGERALYVTWSQRLALESKRQFLAFGPQGLSVDVVTFDELLDELDGAAGVLPREMVPPDDAARRMTAALWRYRDRIDPWDGHGAELYAELHAHFVGRALPIPFRGMSAASGSTLGSEAYMSLRRAAVGAAAARTASGVGAWLAESNLVAELMPGPVRARAIVDRLMAGARLPDRLARLDWIFVDEVQDLTLVESLLLVEMARRVALHRGRMPGLVIAGDEGQTVRPTDFEWGPLSDLLTDRLGARSESVLAGNLRSPRNIATVVNASWDLYRKITKSDRPRGAAAAEIEETTAGRIIQTRVQSDADMERLYEAFRSTPGSALIYPGFEIPAQYGGHDVEVWSSAAVKGLDFQVVGVLDAGRHLVRLNELAARQDGEEGRLASLWARTLADQFRVAISRATDTLVLIDRDDPAALAEVLRLCRREDVAADEPIEGADELDGFFRMDPEELAEKLQHEDGDAQAVVTAYLNEIPKLLLDRPQIALRDARRASGMLGGPRSPGAVTDNSIRREVWKVRGLAALLAGEGAVARRQPDLDLFREANTYLRKAGLVDASRAALWVRDLHEQFRPGGKPAWDDAFDLSRSLSSLGKSVPEAESVFRGALVSWCRRITEAELPLTQPQKKKLVEVVDSVAHRLGERHPEIPAHREVLRRRVARGMLDDGHPRAALEQFEKLAARDFAGEGRCHEALESLSIAADCYEKAGDPVSALRCARGLADFDRAARLAEHVDPAAARTMEWIEAVRTAAGARDIGQAALTEAERVQLLRDLEAELSAAAGVQGARSRGARGRKKPAA